MAKRALIRAAQELFGVEPWVAEGVLSEAADDISVPAAAALITAYFNATVSGGTIAHPSSGLRTLPDVNWPSVGDGDALVYDAETDRIVGGESGGGGIPQWTTNTDFVQYAVVIHDGKLWQANDAHTSAATWAADLAHWTQLDAETDATAIAQLAAHAALTSTAHGGIVLAAAVGAAGGVAALNAAGQLPMAQKPNDLPSRRFRVRRPQLTTIGAAWAATNGALTDDAAGYTDAVAKQITYAAAASGRLSATLGSTLDLTKNGLALAVKADDRTKLSSLDIELSSNTFSQFIAAVSAKSDARIVTDGEWALLPVEIGATAAGVDLTAVNAVRTRGQANATMTPVVSHGLLATFPLVQQARVVVIFDDSLDVSYEMCLRAIRAGVKPCVAVRPGALDTAGHMTTVQAKTLHDRYGVEFIPHAFNVADHDNAVLYQDPVAFEASLKNLRDSCIAKGLVNGIEHYCYAPNYDGSRDTAQKRAAYDLVVKYFPGLARTAYTAGFNGPVEAQVPLDAERHLRVGMYTTGTNSTLVNLQGMLDRASFGRGVAICVFHGIADVANGLVIDRVTFDSFMAEIAGRAKAVASLTAPLPVTSDTLSAVFADTLPEVAQVSTLSPTVYSKDGAGSARGLRRGYASLSNADNARAFINFVGVSHEFGVGGDDNNAGAPANNLVDATKGYVGQVRKIAQASEAGLGISAGEGFVFTGTTVSTFEGRTGTGGAPGTNKPQTAPMRRSARLIGAAQFLTYLVEAGVTSVGILQANQTAAFNAGGTNQADVSAVYSNDGAGGSAVVNDQAVTALTNTGVPIETLIAVKAGDLITIKGPAAAQTYVGGINTYKSTNGIVVNRMGYPGGVLGDMLGGQTSGGLDLGGADQLIAIDACHAWCSTPSIVVIPFLSNDQQYQSAGGTTAQRGVTVANYFAWLTTVVNRIVANGHCVLLVGMVRSNTAASGAGIDTEAAYINVMKNVALSTDHVSFVDLGQVFGTSAAMQAANQQFANSPHMRQIGHAIAARALWRVLNPTGAYGYQALAAA